jgi:hypothetical protein
VKQAARSSDLVGAVKYANVHFDWCLNEVGSLPQRSVPAVLLLVAILFTSSCRHKSQVVASDGWEPTNLYLAQNPATHKGISFSSRYVTMHDGVKIAIDLSLPADLKDGERIPAILRQTRYFRSYDIGWPLSTADSRPVDRKRRVSMANCYFTNVHRQNSERFQNE